MSPTSLTKRCSSCKKELELNRENFYYHNSHKDGFSTLCIPCSKVSFRKHYAKHSERYVQYAREYRKTHKKEIKESVAKYYQKYKHIISPKSSQYQRERIILAKTQVLERFGNKCNNCGFTDWRALQIDHINGNGGEERKTNSGLYFYKYLLTLSDVELCKSYQLLCANCQWIKRFDNREYYQKFEGSRFEIST